jgi:hypothetical protein
VDAKQFGTDVNITDPIYTLEFLFLGTRPRLSAPG